VTILLFVFQDSEQNLQKNLFPKKASKGVDGVGQDRCRDSGGSRMGVDRLTAKDQLAIVCYRKFSLDMKDEVEYSAHMMKEPFESF
jgi:hypothetical protein